MINDIIGRRKNRWRLLIAGAEERRRVHLTNQKIRLLRLVAAFWVGRATPCPPTTPAPQYGSRARAYTYMRVSVRTCAFITYIFHVHGCSINIHFTRTRVGACACCTYKRLYKYRFWASIHPAYHSPVGNAAAFRSLLLGSHDRPPSPPTASLLLLPCCFAF